jgi:hypothetical protein
MHVINLRLFRKLRHRYLHQIEVELAGRDIPTLVVSVHLFLDALNEALVSELPNFEKFKKNVWNEMKFFS